MSFIAATPGEMHAAEILAGAAMALWIFVGLVPEIAAYATRIRVAVVIIYLLGFAAFAIHTLAR